MLTQEIIPSTKRLPAELEQAFGQHLKYILKDPERLLSHLRSRLIAMTNPEIAETRPLIPMADLALAFELCFRSEELLSILDHIETDPSDPEIDQFRKYLSLDTTCSIPITHVLLDLMHMNAEKLYTLSQKNMNDHLPALLSSIEEVLGFPTPDDPFLMVITNSEKYHGAGAVLYDGVAEKIAEKLGEFFILPSSIHEVLAVRRTSRFKIHELKELVRTINRQEVLPKDQLSDQVYKLVENPVKDTAGPAYVLAFADDYDVDPKAL